MASGDEAAFAELFRRFHPKVYQTGIILLKSNEPAEELVQDTFLKVWLRRQELAAVDDFESFLFIMSRNLAYNQLKKYAKERLHVTRMGETGGLSENETDARILDNNYRRIMEEAIARLSPRQQQVWRLSRLEGLNRNEVAERLGLQPYTVKEYLATATKLIRAYFVAHSDLLPSATLLVITCWLDAH